jgi:hypothetical protein
MSPPSFAAATAVRTIDANTYEVDLHDDWCIGSGTLCPLSLYPPH